MDTNDNKIALEMLNDVSAILQSIECDNAAQIDCALNRLKIQIDTFEKVFYKNLLNGIYGAPAFRVNQVTYESFKRPRSNEN